MSYAIGVTSGTADKIEAVSAGGTVALDVVVTQIDKDSSNPPIITTVRTNTGIATATTTKITTDPASGHEALVKAISVTNTSAVSSCTVFLQLTLGTGTLRKLQGQPITLAPGERLEYDGDGRWAHFDANGGAYVAVSLPKTVTVLTVGSGATYTTPPLCRAIKVTAKGGGSGGGGVAGTGGSAAAGGGGGEGGVTIKTFAPPSATYTYTIGAGGAGGASGQNAGSPGSDTTFGSLTAKGAATGGGGASAVVNPGQAIGGTGGVAGTGGDVNLPGSHAPSIALISSVLATSGPGAGLGAGLPLSTEANGNNATANTGAGGGGALTLATVSGNHAGGNGGSGYVVVEEYY